MEATTPPPTEPPGTPAGVESEKKASGGLRAGAVVLALVLAFASAVMIAVMVDIGDSPTCADVASGEATLGDDLECFEGSSFQKTIALVLGWPGGALLGVATLLALAFAIRGRGGRLLGQVAGAGVALSVLSIVLGSI